MSLLSKIAWPFTRRAAHEAALRVAADQQRRLMYEVARVTRLNQELNRRSRTQLAEPIGTQDRRKLRDIGRYLVRNHPCAERAITYIADRVIGQGIYPQFDTGDRGLDAELNESFRDWARACDLNGEDSFADLQWMLLMEQAACGEAFLAWSIVEGRMVLMPIESEQLEDAWGANSTGARAGEVISGGVVYNSTTGRKVRYILRSDDEFGAGTSTTPGGLTEVPAEQMIHFFLRKRPTQRRGISDFASVAQPLYDVQDADYAELQLIRLATYFGLYLKKSPDSIGDDLDDDGANTDTDSKIEEISQWEPGMVRSGTADPTVLDVKRPSGEYQSFRVAMNQLCAARLNVPYPAMSGDTSKANYSSRRGEEMDCRPGQRRLQRRLITGPCWRTVGAWARWESLRKGGIRLPAGLDPDRVARWAKYPLPGVEWVDVSAEAKAMQAKLDNGLWTYADACAHLGKDATDTLVELSAEVKSFEAQGLVHPYIRATMSVAPATMTTEEPDPVEDDSPEDPADDLMPGKEGTE